MHILLFVITVLSLHLYLLLLVCQAAQLTHILEGRVRELAEDTERERALNDMAKATNKERVKITVTAEKKAAASEKYRVSTEKRLSDFEAKLGETELKLAEAESLNTARAEELADLWAAFEGCESKWYDEGFDDAENSVEPVINETWKLAFKEGWLAALQAVGVPEDSPLKDPNQIPLPSLLTTAQKTPIIFDEKEMTSFRELVEQIDAYAEPIDLEATSNPNIEDQHGGNIQPPLETQHAPMDIAQIQFVDPSP